MTTNRSLLCALGVAGLSSGALAQAITADIDGDIVPGGRFTLMLSASYGGTDYAVAGIATSLVINDAQGVFSGARLVAPMDGPGTSAGVIGAGSIDGILAGQLNFPTAGIFADPSNPIAFWEADFDIDASLSGPVVLDFETVTSRYDVYLARDRASSESRLGDLTEAAGQVIIPAPASGVLLLAGLALAARRR